MHRNQQRKEQQLDRIRHLRHLQNNESPLQTSLQKTSQQPLQSSQQSSQHSPKHSPKQPLMRSLCRNSRRDNNHNNSNDSTFGSQSKSESNPNSNMSLRSVNKSVTPSVGSQLKARNPIQSTLSSKLRLNASLPQSSAQHSVSSQSKLSLTPINSNNKVRHKSLSSTTTTEPNISPEILFLIKEQAKAIAKINALQKKVDHLEQKVNSQSCSNNSNDNSAQELSHEISTASSSSTTKFVNNSSNCKGLHVISDDSGGEYSRATTTTSDEDELSSLLDRIARCSQQLHNSQQNKSTNESNSNSNRLIPQSMQMRQKLMYSLSNPIHRSHSTLETTQENNTLSDCHESHPQTTSALLFEPNVETVLKNIDQIIATQPIIAIKTNSTSTMKPSYHKQTEQHSSPSLYEAIGITSTGVSQSLLATNSNSSTNWHLERVRTIIKQREEQEFESQMRLNDEWLQTQLKTQPFQRQQRLSNYIDSLEPTFR